MKNQALFEICTSFTEDIFGLSFTIADTLESIYKFCKLSYFHSLQSHLDPAAMEFMIARSKHSKIYYFEDALRLHFILFYCEGTPILVGPYLNDTMNYTAALSIIKMRNLKEITVEDLLIYYGKFPVLSEQLINRIINALFHKLDLENPEVSYITYHGNEDSKTGEITENQIEKTAIAEHYRREALFMNAIQKGNAREALAYLRETEKAGRGLMAMTSLHVEQTSAAIARTMARIATYNAGVPAYLIHRITIKYSKRIMSVPTVEKLKEEKSNMIRELCQVVLDLKTQNYSALVQSVLYTLNQDYSKDITVSSIAKELEISESYLVLRFRKETGETPLQYLQKIRLEQASRMLVSSKASIRDISSSVGIPDSNYFVKLFKRKYHMTPSEYQRLFRL